MIVGKRKLEALFSDESLSQLFQYILKIILLIFCIFEDENRVQIKKPISMSTKDNNYNNRVWDLLNESRNNWYGHDEQEGSHWPCNRKEIRATKKVLRKIRYKRLTDQSVIDEYNEQKRLIKVVKENLPNNRLKMIKPLAILFSVMLFYLWFAHPKKENVYTPDDWKITVPSEFISSSDWEPKMKLERKTINPGTVVTPMAIGEQHYAKVKLPSGEIGYMHLSSFSGMLRNIDIYEGTKVFTLTEKRKDIAKIGKEIPNVIATPIIDNETSRYIKVKTSNGQIGYIHDSSVEYHFSDSLLDINTDYVLPVASTKAKKWVGKNISEIEEHYSPVSSCFANTCYWENIRIIADTVAYSGIIAKINQDGIIQAIQFGKPEHLYAVIKFFPLWRMLASIEPFYGISYGYYEQYDRELHIGWWDKLRSSHWTVRFITWIILAILKIVWFLINLSIQFLPIMVIGVFISHLERPSYRFAWRTVIWLLILVFLYIITLSFLQDSIHLLALIILAIAAFVNFLGFASHLNRKCYICGNWDGEITEKTDFLGNSTEIKHGTENRYMGSEKKQTGISTSGNTTTHHYTTTNYYKRVKTKDTYEYENYKAHKLCKYCGVRWKEDYKVLKNERHEEY